MKLYQKLIIAFAAVSLPIAAVYLAVIVSIHKEITHVGQFHTPNLFVVQKIAFEAMAAVEGSFAYLASGDPREKEAFLKWGGNFVERMREFDSLPKVDEEEMGGERPLFEAVLSAQAALVEKARAMFAGYESRGRAGQRVFNQYKAAVNEFRGSLNRLIQHEKEEVDEAQATAVRIIRRNEIASALLVVLTTLLAIGSGLVMARVICRPILKLKEASEEISRGNFDVEIVSESKDEIGDLGRGIARMSQDLKERHGQLQASNAALAEKAAELESSKEQIHDAFNHIQALRDIDLAIASTLDLKGVLEVLLEKLDMVIPGAAATVRLFNRETGLLEPVVCRSIDENDWRLSEGVNGRGIPNLVFGSKTSLLIPNLQTDPRVREPEFFRKYGLIAGLCLPLIVKGDTIGTLGFYTKKEWEFDDKEVEFLQTLAGQASLAIHKSQLLAEAKERAEAQEALATIAQATSQSLELNDVLRIALDEVLKLTGREKGYIRLKDSMTGQINLAVQRGISEEYIDTLLHHRTPGGKIDQVFDTGEPLVINEPTRSILKEETRREGVACVAWIPIKAGRRTIGVLNIQASKPVPFQRREIEVLKAIGHIIGIAVENSRLFEGIKEQAETLAKASRVKDEFLSVMSHELRTPLMTIMGYAGLLQERALGETNPEQDKALGNVLRQARDLLEIITGILFATEIETGTVQVNKHEVDLNQFMAYLKSAYGLPPRQELALVWDTPPQLPSINTDDEKLKHILRNLVNNAIKFTEKGTVTISTRLGVGPRPPTPSPSFVEFTVSDTGEGIPEELLPSIFNRFSRSDNSETRLHGGVGLGLYIVKRFTELLGGTIEVKSEPGKGSTFTVRIPYASV